MTKTKASKGSRTSKIYLDPMTNIVHPLVIKRRRSREKIIPFGWYGGKFSHLDWLLPLLPKTRQYCEPFGGSAAVLLNRNPSLVETYNDIDGELVNFFRVLRSNSKELVDALALTPCSREEFMLAINPGDTPDSKIERARLFYIRVAQCYASAGQVATLGNWGYKTSLCRCGMSKLNSTWLGGVCTLEKVAQRLLRVQIENRPALDIFRIYDDKETTFYCDPPYLAESRVAKHVYHEEMNRLDYDAFGEAVNTCKGKVAVSGYDHLDMKRYFSPKHWYKHLGAVRPIAAGGNKTKRQEVLWTNYKPARSRAFV